MTSVSNLLLQVLSLAFSTKLELVYSQFVDHACAHPRDIQFELQLVPPSRFLLPIDQFLLCCLALFSMSEDTIPLLIRFLYVNKPWDLASGVLVKQGRNASQGSSKLSGWSFSANYFYL